MFVESPAESIPAERGRASILAAIRGIVAVHRRQAGSMPYDRDERDSVEPRQIP
jgi:hypothetical protein